MQLQIRLYGALRDAVPDAERGKLSLTFPASISIDGLLGRLALTGHVQVAVNGEIVQEWQRSLQDGDKVEMFRPAAGG